MSLNEKKRAILSIHETNIGLSSMNEEELTKKEKIINKTKRLPPKSTLKEKLVELKEHKDTLMPRVYPKDDYINAYKDSYIHYFKHVNEVMTPTWEKDTKYISVYI